MYIQSKEKKCEKEEEEKKVMQNKYAIFEQVLRKKKTKISQAHSYGRGI